MKKNQQVRPLLGRYYPILAVAAIFLSACAAQLTVRSDIDPAADFSQYKTFNFFSPMGIEGGFNSPIFGEHYRAAISRELQARGYRKADKPDLLINVTLRVDDKVSIRGMSRPYLTGAYYGNPMGAYAGSAVGVGVGVGTRATKSTEVSIFIDFVDLERHQVAWQGVTMFKANDKVATQLRDAIYTSVNKVLAQYPYSVER